MEQKPKSIKLVDFKEELLPSGRKLLHCIFENRYGSRFYYSWTMPWKDKQGEYGVEKLFLRSLETEEWNDYEGVWSEELRKVSKEVPSLEEMKLPVDVYIGEGKESAQYAREGGGSAWEFRIDIRSREADAIRCIEDEEEYIRIGEVCMLWCSLRSGLLDVIEEGGEISAHVGESMLGGRPVVNFWVLIEKAMDKSGYQTISREIACRIRHFIRSRLSEYNALKKGFEE